MSTPHRERFLPIHREKLIELLCVEPFHAAHAEEFKRLCRMLQSLFHYEFHQVQERFKSALSHFDAEAEQRFGASTEQQKEVAAREIADTLDRLLSCANYGKVPLHEVSQAMKRASAFQIGLRVDLDDFEEIVVYRRREVQREELLPVYFGLRTKKLHVASFDRVCLFVRFKGEKHFLSKQRKDLPFRPGSICLKLFHTIPKSDLQMLFPSAQVQMRMVDRLIIGVPALVGTLHFLVFKLGGAALGAIVLVLLFWLGLRDEEPDMKAALAACLGLGVLGAFLIRQWIRFKNRKIYFLKVLTENLYYRNLDNGPGVVFHLLDVAEEAEVNEAILAYSFLQAADGPIARAELDRRVEAWLEAKLGPSIDFEVDDAMRKLERLELVTQDAEQRYSAVPLPESLVLLDRRWDALLDACAI